MNTQSRRGTTGCPSSPGQLELGRMLAGELGDAGLAVEQGDGDGLVIATLLASGPDGSPSGAPVIGLLAHLDTSPDVPGAGVQPIVHQVYGGGVIELPRGGTRLDPSAMSELRDLAGHDLVTSSGDTLLGADDKAGAAEIMAAVAHLAAHPELPRPTLRVCFTPDEEIGGVGASRLDLERFGALCAYTLDGHGVGNLEDETFSGREAIVTVEGVDVHPGQAAGKLVNAGRVAARIVAALPADRLTPETTADREGFLHPYQINATAARAEIRIIARDFDETLLDGHVMLLRKTAAALAASTPGAKVTVEVSEQYRNMRIHLDAFPEVAAAAQEAIRREGIDPVRRAIRGGTDGSLLTARGLPTPNIFTGGGEYHSPREYASVQHMGSAAAVIVHLAAVWAERGISGAAGWPDPSDRRVAYRPQPRSGG